MTSSRELLLLFVAYHPSQEEVDQLLSCLRCLPHSIGYAVIANDYTPGEPITCLFECSDYYIISKKNLGYGKAVNTLFSNINNKPTYIAAMNTDVTWPEGTFDSIISWMKSNVDVSLVVPQIRDSSDNIQKLCKQDPTILGLFSRRFLPNKLKPSWLKRYDRWYSMENKNYLEDFEACYLSGCCMIIPTNSFIKVSGFDENFFLYLEDADLTRKLSSVGRCLHYSKSYINHNWGRGNYKSLKLMIVNIVSAFYYFSKWGWRLW